jgi:hypothetical protein
MVMGIMMIVLVVAVALYAGLVLADWNEAIDLYECHADWRQRMPHLSQTTLKFLDDTDLGDPICVTYLLGGDLVVASGFYGGLPRDGAGDGCVAVEGLHGGRVLIRMLDVVSVTGTKQVAGREAQ